MQTVTNMYIVNLAIADECFLIGIPFLIATLLHRHWIFGFAIPLCLILVFYWLVIRKLKTVGPKNKSKEKKRSHRKVTNLVLTVVTVDNITL
ncbi:hypothetical protein NQ318_005330 [Aromia moschata]|uniref:G-protein coupled receptors family 1 profile domain-containing protein n=1 Tax=Aromia moschata TaxID=1265417 RepID=A0AAV8XI65_9CUCU|nr:hypothetical protein NQ318_005330 [Aromia moschata]